MTKTPIQPPTRQDLLIFQGLQRAIVEKKAFIKIDFKALNKIGSPFFNPWENVLPLLVILTLSLVSMIVNNLMTGTIVLTVLVLGYAFLMPFFFGTVYAKPRGQACRSPNRKVFNRMAIRRIFDLPFRRCAGFLLCAARGLADVCGILFSRFDSRRQYGRIR